MVYPNLLGCNWQAQLKVEKWTSKPMIGFHFPTTKTTKGECFCIPKNYLVHINNANIYSSVSADTIIQQMFL